MSKSTSFSDILVEWLARHDGRDKIIRLLLYGSSLVASTDRIKAPIMCASDVDSLKKSLSTFASKLSETRRVLRLFDDLPMLKYSLHYGFGETENEPDTLLRRLGFLKNLADQLYYPTDHLGWATENGIISKGKDIPWTSLSVLFWAISLQLGIAKAIRYIKIIRTQRIAISKSDLNSDRSNNLLRLDERQLFQVMSIIQSGSDLINAIHWLPKDWLGWLPLWSGKLKPHQVAFLGTVSSAVSIYKTVRFQ